MVKPIKIRTGSPPCAIPRRDVRVRIAGGLPRRFITHSADDSTLTLSLMVRFAPQSGVDKASEVASWMSIVSPPARVGWQQCCAGVLVVQKRHDTYPAAVEAAQTRKKEKPC